MPGRRCSATEEAIRYSKTMTITEAAAKAGISRSTLMRALRAEGQPPRKPIPGGTLALARRIVADPQPNYFADGTPLT